MEYVVCADVNNGYLVDNDRFYWILTENYPIIASKPKVFKGNVSSGAIWFSDYDSTLALHNYFATFYCDIRFMSDKDFSNNPRNAIIFEEFNLSCRNFEDDVIMRIGESTEKRKKELYDKLKDKEKLFHMGIEPQDLIDQLEKLKNADQTLSEHIREMILAERLTVHPFIDNDINFTDEYHVIK